MKLKNKLLLGSLTAVLLAVMSFSAWKILVIRSEYHAGEAAYEDISHMISLPQKTAEPQPSVINKPAGAETLPDEDDTIWPEVDFAALREINPDIVAWIYIEGTKINYPIVQGEDNSYYLKHLFSGEWNGSGCIFLDFRNDASFADRHSIIYGHHMKNGTMFTDLDKYKKQEFFDEHPVALLLTPDKNYKVKWISSRGMLPHRRTMRGKLVLRKRNLKSGFRMQLTVPASPARLHRLPLIVF